MFCAGCGLEIRDGVRFCPHCGKQVVKKAVSIASSASGETYSMKCRMCEGTMELEQGNILVCPYCGNKEMITENPEVSKMRMRASAYRDVEIERLRVQKEIARYRAEEEYDRQSGSSTSELMAQLTEIDLSQPRHVRLFHKEEDLKKYEIEKIKKKVELIKNYPLPQSFRGLLDFLQMAETSINVSASRHIPLGLKLFISNKDVPGKEVSDAWLELYMRIYSTIRSRYSRDPRFPDVELSYQSKMRQLNRL